jgi:uncharacterized protein (UPF0212 family)
MNIKRPKDIAYKPERIINKKNFIAIPIKLTKCPKCGSEPGVMCVGINTNDTCHEERLFQCMIENNHG